MLMPLVSAPNVASIVERCAGGGCLQQVKDGGDLAGASLVAGQTLPDGADPHTRARPGDGRETVPDIAVADRWRS